MRYAPGLFVDWLSLEQVHDVPMPRINDGRVISIDADGSVSWEVDRAFSVEGSFESKVQVICDGNRVRFSGNIGRFNRTDNLFGFEFPECMRRINHVLQGLGLP